MVQPSALADGHRTVLYAAAPEGVSVVNDECVSVSALVEVLSHVPPAAAHAVSVSLTPSEHEPAWR
jgi:hypothetical protein